MNGQEKRSVAKVVVLTTSLKLLVILFFVTGGI